MKKRFLTLLVLTFGTILFSSSLFAQSAQKGEKEKKVKTYRLRLNYKVNTFYVYKLTKKEKIHRVYSDSSTKDYERDATYYLTGKIMNFPSKGFQPIDVVIDSLKYRFKDGDAEFTFNSVDLKGNAARFKDLNMRTPCLGRDFEMTYSPYGEVSAIKSDDIDETLDYVRKNGKGALSEIDMFAWTNGLSRDKLAYLADMKKIVIPDKRYAIDSVWFSPIVFDANGYYFFDTLATRIAKYNAGVFYIEGYSTSLTPSAMKMYSYNVDKLITIDSCSGGGKVSMELKANGVIKKLTIDYKIKAKIKAGNSSYYEFIDSKAVWERIQTYRL